MLLTFHRWSTPRPPSRTGRLGTALSGRTLF
uniref:Uncharacterized protein n=1 Tax=Anguilla anguilla TaxID=7936 RepID=A0A0E9T6E2_ANGAN